MEKEKIIKIAEKIKEQYMKEIEKYIVYKNIQEINFFLSDRLAKNRERVDNLLEETQVNIKEDFFEEDENNQEYMKLEESTSEDYFADIDKSKLPQSEIMTLEKINQDLQDQSLDEEIREQVINMVVELCKSKNLVQRGRIVSRAIDDILEDIEIDEDYEESDIYEIINETTIIDIVINIINFSNYLNDSFYPNDWTKVNISELAKPLAIDNVEIEPEYLKTIYQIYYKKCKTSISKLGVKLSYYKTLLFERIYGIKVDMSKDEANEILKLALFQKCLEENWQVFAIANGPFYGEFNDYIVNEGELPKHVLESDISLINYLFEQNIIAEAISKTSFDNINIEENMTLEKLKKIKYIDELEELARNGLFKEFIDEKKSQILQSRARENNNIPIDVFCAIIINSCAGGESIRKMMREIDLNKREINSGELFDLVSICLYAENRFYHQINKQELADIGQILYKIIKDNKEKESIEIPRELKNKSISLFNTLEEITPRIKMNFESEDIEL